MATDGVTGARERLVQAIVDEGFERATIEVREEEAPFGLRAILAATEDAYPGTGARAAVVDAEGVGYGRALDRGLGDLARKLGWRDAPPDAAALLRVVSLVTFDGLLAPTAEPPELARGKDGALELRFTRVAFPSGALEPMRVRVGDAGRAEVQILPAPGPGGPTPIDATTAFLRAMDGGDASQIMLALAKVPRPFGARELAALARAAALPNEGIATTALVTMGGDPPALAALRDALGAAPERRDEVAAWVAELYGPDAAQGL